MKIKIEDLLVRRAALDKVLVKDLPFKLSYRLTRIASKFMTEMKIIEKTRVDMIKSIGKEQENGSFKLEEPKQQKRFKEEWEDFTQQEIELDIQKIPFELLEEGKVELSAYDMANLELFLTEPLTGAGKKKKKEEDKKD